MKKLKKFNENWINEETELNLEEGNNDLYDKPNPIEEEFSDKLFDLCHEYEDKLSLGFLSNIFMNMHGDYSQMEYDSRKNK